MPSHPPDNNMALSWTWTVLFCLPLILFPMYHFSSLIMKGDGISKSLGDQVEPQASSQASVQKQEINMTFVSETVEWLKNGIESGTQLVFTKVLCITS